MGQTRKRTGCNALRNVQTDQNPVAAVKLSQEQRDVTKHDEIADEDRHNVRVALPVQLILNGTLQSITTSQVCHLKFHRNSWVIHWKYHYHHPQKNNKQRSKQTKTTTNNNHKSIWITIRLWFVENQTKINLNILRKQNHVLSHLKKYFYLSFSSRHTHYFLDVAIWLY